MSSSRTSMRPRSAPAGSSRSPRHARCSRRPSSTPAASRSARSTSRPTSASTRTGISLSRSSGRTPQLLAPEASQTNMSSLTPREIVQELDKHIIGQDAAKRAVAIALRNRWRRMQVQEPLRQEITPKNILMIGPTGVGKTEIARRLAKLANAPFVKVEATKFTEVGYVGRDVDSIVKELADVAVKMTREQEMEKVRQRAADAAEERVLDALLPRPRTLGFSTDEPREPRDAETRQKFRAMLRQGELDDREIEVELRMMPMGVEIMAPPGMEEMQQQLQSMFQSLGGNRTRTRKVKVQEARRLLTDEEASKLINEDELKVKAVANAEQNGIVFIDELDKVTRRQETIGADVSR